MQEGDLAEGVAAPKRAQRAAVDRDLELAVGDRVEELARLALVHDLLAGRGLHGHELARERLQLRRPERREQRQRAEQ